MRRKVVATVELEFDVEDPTHLLPHPEWTEARQANLRQLIEDAVRSGLTKADGAPVAAVNHVAVTEWSASP
jgi:hypothetical protein